MMLAAPLLTSCIEEIDPMTSSVTEKQAAEAPGFFESSVASLTSLPIYRLYGPTWIIISGVICFCGTADCTAEIFSPGFWDIIAVISTSSGTAPACRLSETALYSGTIG